MTCFLLASSIPDKSMIESLPGRAKSFDAGKVDLPNNRSDFRL
ncbi:Uncharacterised protein [uncultured archaeon]|nr:Uncharacterised protein [uncultured archaeon]